jgi:hypothetical protein
MERRRARHKPEGAVRPKAANAKSFRAPAILRSKRSSLLMSSKREGIVRPITSLTLTPYT